MCPRAEVHVAVVFPRTAMHRVMRCPRTNSAGLRGAQDRGVWGNRLPRRDVQWGTMLLRTGHVRLRTEVHRITVTWAFCAQDRCELRHGLPQDTAHRSTFCTWTGVPCTMVCLGQLCMGTSHFPVRMCAVPRCAPEQTRTGHGVSLVDAHGAWCDLGPPALAPARLLPCPMGALCGAVPV